MAKSEKKQQHGIGHSVLVRMLSIHKNPDDPCAVSCVACINYHKGGLVLLTHASYNSPENVCRYVFCGKPIRKSGRELVSSKSPNTHYKINIIHVSCFSYWKHIFGMIKCHINYAEMNIAFLKWRMVTDSNAPN